MGPKEEASAAVLVRPVLLDVTVLRCHEHTRPELTAQLQAEIRRDRALRRPILVADGDFVILDGHHRFEALRRLGCRKVPAYVVDYFSEVVEVGAWPDASVQQVTKEEVIRRGTTGNLFPPKTSRHTVRVGLGDHPVPLGDLL